MIFTTCLAFNKTINSQELNQNNQALNNFETNYRKSIIKNDLSVFAVGIIL